MPVAADGLLTDEQIGQVVKERFGIELSAYLAAVQPTTSSTGEGSRKSRSKGSVTQVNGHNNSSSEQYDSVDAFVAQMGKLLELEKQAEVTAAHEATTHCSTETAQVSSCCADNALTSTCLPVCMRSAVVDMTSGDCEGYC